MNHVTARARHHRKLLRAHRAGEAGRFEKAEAIYRQYIRQYPQDPQVLFNLGVLMQRRADNPTERHEAADFYHRAIASPDCEIAVKSNAMNNLGLIMGKINEVEKAGICFGMALQMNPANNAARINFADILRHNGQYEEADREFAEVLRLDPNSDTAKFSQGMIALMLGDVRRGFTLYESRFGVESFPTRPFKTNKPKWNGEDLNGKTILITEEQGFGDTFMFCRYWRDLKQKWPNCQIWFYGNVLYRNLLKGVDGLDRFFAAGNLEVSSDGLKRVLSLGDKIDDFDYHCPLLSLPYQLGTTFETIPSAAPYIRPVDEWSKYVGLRGYRRHSRHVGLCWAGSPRHGKDKWRSLEPEAFQSLIGVHPECVFYSIQCGPKAGECARLTGIIDLADTITDWSDTAQAILQLDLVISVDTATVHLAGALDKPCWMLTPHSPDWRWMLTREDSPWYPKLRLFRQPKQYDWETPLKRINEELK